MLFELLVALTAVAKADEHDVFGVTTDEIASREVASRATQMCEAEFGEGWRIADWNEVRLEEEIDHVVVDLAIPVSQNERYYFVTRNGEFLFGGYSRQYFVERHDGDAPGNWLVHDQTADQTLSLGSWYNIRGPVLCFNTAFEEAIPGVAPEYSNLGKGKCADVYGNQIDEDYDYLHGQGRNCEQFCSEDARCTGYSVSIYQNCLIWRTPLAEAHPVNEYPWGDADCHRKNIPDDHDDDDDHSDDHDDHDDDDHAHDDVSVHIYVTHATFTDDEVELASAACIEEGNQFGETWRLADWADVYVEAEHDPEGIALEVTPTMTDRVWFVTAGGEMKHSGVGGQFFVRRADDRALAEWMKHDETEDELFVLGSGSNLEGPALCILDDEEGHADHEIDHDEICGGEGVYGKLKNVKKTNKSKVKMLCDCKDRCSDEGAVAYEVRPGAKKMKCTCYENKSANKSAKVKAAGKVGKRIVGLI